MKNNIFIGLMAFVFSLAMVSAAYALPCAFGGTVTLNGTAVAGELVTAYNPTGGQVGTGHTTIPGGYGISVENSTGLQIYFKVAGALADQGLQLCGDGTFTLLHLTATDNDNDGDNYRASQDCNDNNAAVHPGATEICNGLDDNCVNGIDEGNICYIQYYCDSDSDTYISNIVSGACATYNCIPGGCSPGAGTDCLDTNNAVHPGASEVCNGLDDDCDGSVDGAICGGGGGGTGGTGGGGGGGCTPTWVCGDWSDCAPNGTQNRTCTDSNNCNKLTGKPAETQACTYTAGGGGTATCTPNWVCGDWTECIDGTQTRTCTDQNVCGISADKPAEEQTCTVMPAEETTPAVTTTGMLIAGVEDWILGLLAIIIIIIIYLLWRYYNKKHQNNTVTKSRQTKRLRVKVNK